LLAANAAIEGKEFGQPFLEGGGAGGYENVVSGVMG
jgi:hypothetical protein